MVKNKITDIALFLPISWCEKKVQKNASKVARLEKTKNFKQVLKK
jgi:hypothetical protein